MNIAPCAVTSEKVFAYEGMVQSHAAKFTRLPGMQNDFDDFCQYGRFAVWQSLEGGFPPSNKVVTDRMTDWSRIRNRQLRGQSPLPEDDEALAG